MPLETHQTLLFRGETMPHMRSDVHPAKVDSILGPRRPFAILSLTDHEEKGGSKLASMYFDTPGQISELMAELSKLHDLFAVTVNAPADPAVVPLEHSPEFSRPLKPGETEPGVPPWPVAPGTNTTGWSDSQKLGEQPSPEVARQMLRDGIYGDGDSTECTIELSPEPVDPWKERGEVSDPAETPTDEIALPAPLPLCRSCNFMLALDSEIAAGICQDCAAISEKVQF